MSVIRRRGKWCIRYYGPDGRQRWETVGPNRKEAETVLSQRLYEARLGIYPILRRRIRQTFADLAEEWFTKYATPNLRDSTRATYRWLLDDHILPAFGASALSEITADRIQAYMAEQAARLSPKSVNASLALLRQILEAACDWGRLPSNPARRVRRLRVIRQELRLWTIAEIRRFCLSVAGDTRWGALFITAIFTGLRTGELQALHASRQNWPNFTTNKIEVTCEYSQRAKRITPPKTRHSVRAVDMAPIVRHVLRPLAARGGVLFPGIKSAVRSQPDINEAFHRLAAAAEVPQLRVHDCRHLFASLLIMAGKNVKYISTQMGHHSAAFTLDVYGHLMDRLPVHPVEWIDELVFPEGFEAALILHLSGAPQGANGSKAVQPAKAAETRTGGHS